MFSPHAFPAAEPNSDYVAGSQNELMVMVQIESRPGLESVEEIARVDGIDALLIGGLLPPADEEYTDFRLGPFDLALQTGLQRAGQEHEAAIQRILHAAHAAGKKAAIFCMLPSSCKSYVARAHRSSQAPMGVTRECEQSKASTWSVSTPMWAFWVAR